MKLLLLVVGLVLVSNIVTAVPMDMDELIDYVKEKLEGDTGGIQEESIEEEELTGGVEKTPEDTSSMFGQ